MGYQIFRCCNICFCSSTAGCLWSVKTLRSSGPSSSWRTKWLSSDNSRGTRTKRTSDRTSRAAAAAAFTLVTLIQKLMIPQSERCHFVSLADCTKKQPDGDFMWNCIIRLLRHSEGVVHKPQWQHTFYASILKVVGCGIMQLLDPTFHRFLKRDYVWLIEDIHFTNGKLNS